MINNKEEKNSIYIYRCTYKHTYIYISVLWLMMSLKKNTAKFIQNLISVSLPSTRKPAANISPGNIEYMKHPLKIIPTSDPSTKGNKTWR